MPNQEEKTYRGNVDERHKEAEKRMNWLEERYSTFNSEMGKVKEDLSSVKIAVEGIKINVEWLVKTYWVLVTASLGSFFSLAVYIVFSLIKSGIIK